MTLFNMMALIEPRVPNFEAFKVQRGALLNESINDALSTKELVINVVPVAC